jgi:hypothetical protein
MLKKPINKAEIANAVQIIAQALADANVSYEVGACAMQDFLIFLKQQGIVVMRIEEPSDKKGMH